MKINDTVCVAYYQVCCHIYEDIFTRITRIPLSLTLPTGSDTVIKLFTKIDIG